MDGQVDGRMDEWINYMKSMEDTEQRKKYLLIIYYF